MATTAKRTQDPVDRAVQLMAEMRAATPETPNVEFQATYSALIDVLNGMTQQQKDAVNARLIALFAS